GDSAFTDNLGVFSVVRRLCQQITIVDAEYDPAYKFESYIKLKTQLKEELNAELAVEEIDRFLTNTQTGDTEGHGCKDENERCKPMFSGETPIMSGRIGPFPFKDDTQSGVEQVSLDVVRSEERRVG